jgi:small subunit ribosomal protein S4
MAVYNTAKCRLCRRSGEKLFLKGERCYTPKCGVSRRAYPPGQQGKQARIRLTEYGIQLKEKQKIRRSYGMMERQFFKYVKDAVSQKGNSVEILLSMLERRLDNIVYRAGFAASRPAARLLVNHGHFKVDGKKVNIPSFIAKVGQIISVEELSAKKNYFKNLSETLAKTETPSWLATDKEKMEIKVVSEPTSKEVMLVADIKPVIEYYSR